MAVNYGYAYLRYRGDDVIERPNGFAAYPGDVFMAKITDPHDERDCYTIDLPFGMPNQVTLVYETDKRLWCDWELLS